MTKQESFKRRVRARMDHTGERYAAARRALLSTTSRSGRTWVAEPETTDDAVREATGHGWDDWCDIIEAGPVAAGEHPAIVAWLTDEHDIGGWWAQAVTVGYERISGRRLRHQMADGTFTANKSKTITADVDLLRRLLLDDDDRTELLAGMETELRSRPTARNIRLRLDPGVAEIAITDKGAGRCQVVVAHQRLPELADVEQWKLFWADWLEAIDGS